MHFPALPPHQNLGILSYTSKPRWKASKNLQQIPRVDVTFYPPAPPTGSYGASVYYDPEGPLEQLSEETRAVICVQEVKWLVLAAKI